MQFMISDGIELVGLRGTSNGRSCPRHASCGEQVAVGTRVRFISIKLESILRFGHSTR
jgi:hypothetical protein